MRNPRFLIKIGDGFEFFPSRNVIRSERFFATTDLA
jgi:hypothetical protein